MKDLGNQQYQYQLNDTNMILSGNNKRHGIISLKRPEFQEEIIKTETTFLLNLYRLNSKGKFRGLARREPFTVSQAGETGITLDFPPTEVSPLNMQASYTVQSESTVDLTVSLQSEQDLEDYEVFISSYFNGSLEPTMIIPNWPQKTADEDMLFYKVEEQPLLKGYYLYFPRDDRAVHTFYDGRWIDPNKGEPIIDMIAGPMYGKPIAILANEHLSIIQMAEVDECPGMLITYSGGEPDDPIYTHHAAYFSLFGTDIKAGEKRQTRVRQVVRPGMPSMQEVLQMYEEFTNDSKL